MSLVTNINQFLAAILDTFKKLGRGRIWLWLLSYFGLQALVLIAHWQWLSPVFHGPISTWLAIAKVLPDTLLPDTSLTLFKHYPQHFLVLGAVFTWAKTIIALLFEGVVLGAIAILFHNAFLTPEGEPPIAVASVWAAWPKLIGAWLILNLCFIAINLGLPGLFGDLLAKNPRRQLALEFGVIPAAYTIILALFLVTIPAITTLGDGLFQALGRSLRLFGRRPFAMLFFAALILVLPLMIAGAAARSVDIVQKFQPELVAYLLMLGLVAEMIAYFFWMGVGTRFLLDIYEE